MLRVLNGILTYHSSMERLGADEERFVLLAMHQALVERALCVREHTPAGTLLISPSYYRRERPEWTGHPAVLVSYHFHGFLDDIYATLVVRLHHSQTMKNDQLWRYAADFKTLTGKQLGVKLTRLGEGAGELDVYFDPAIPVEEKEARHAEYWRVQAFPVLLVFRTSDGEVRWMAIRDYLKRESDNGKKAVKQIVFDGERFDVMSVRRWRDSVLGLKQS